MHTRIRKKDADCSRTAPAIGTCESSRRFRSVRVIGMAALLLSLPALTSAQDSAAGQFLPAGTGFTLLHHYPPLSALGGCQPQSTLVETSPGVYYGTTSNCGATLFTITSAGVYTDLAAVPGASYPWGALLHASNGMLYGVTAGGDTFRSDLAGNINVLVPGSGNGTGFPLMEDQTETLYGITGAYPTATLFSMTLDGVMTPLHTFDASTDGTPGGGVIMANDGNLYGATTNGVYRCTPSGTVTFIYTFPANANPFGKLTQGAGGKLYGVTNAYPNAVYSLNLDGSGITWTTVSPSGSEDTSTGLAAIAPSGVLFGGTRLGGKGGGTLYAFEPPSTVRTLITWPLHQLNAPITPSNGVTIGSDGRLYGTLASVATLANDLGGIYAVNLGLRPPRPSALAFAPTSGSPGTSVLIRGIHFLGTTSVSFNGTQATFTATGDGFLRTTVPAGATSGPITITTPNGSDTTKQSFTVQ